MPSTRTPCFLRVAFTMAAASLPFAGPLHAQQAPPLLTQALTCKLQDSELAALPTRLKAIDSGFQKPALQHGAPTFNLYRLSHPITAFGYTSSEIVMQPDRILLLVPRVQLAEVEKAQGLQKVEYLPSEKVLGNNRSIVAYQFQGIDAVQGKVMVGCQYGVAEAATWGSE